MKKMRQKGGKKRWRRREERRKEGIEEILPLVFSQTEAVWLLVRVSAAELALFHTGAILSTLGYHLPETATWERSGGDKCVFGVCVRKRLCVQKCVCVCAQSRCFRQNLYIQPPLRSLRSLSVSTFVQSVRDLQANLKYLCIFQSVFFCSLAWMLSGLVQQFVKPFVNRSWTFVVMGFKMSLLFILHCFLLLKLQIHTEKLSLALTKC